MPGKVILEVTSGPIEERSFEFDEPDLFIFGRAADCHAALPPNDRTASRHHFVLELNPPEARLRDLGSLNGTWVNGVKRGGRPADETPKEAARRSFPDLGIHHGDRIRVGQTTFAVRVELPIYCAQCGAALPELEEPAGSGAVCPACAAGDATLLEEAPTVPAVPPRCGKCGKDVADEIGAGRRGDYICRACRGEVSDDPAAALIGFFLDKVRGQELGEWELPGYEIGPCLGKGGMGAVYLARRKEDGASVAVKVMLSQIAVSEHARKEFLRELEVTRGLQHPNCVQLHDCGGVGSGFFFAMEFCPGGSADGLMKRSGGRLSVDEAAPIMLESLAGLGYLHQQGFVHRDLKPQNILLTARRGGTAKLADFGLSKSFERAGFSGFTKTGTAGGTAPFMPREQVTNYKYVKPISDLWSLAATFYHMLTGALVRDFDGRRDPIEVILSAPVVPIRKRSSSVPRKLARVLHRALSDDSKERYPTAPELREALEQALGKR